MTDPAQPTIDDCLLIDLPQFTDPRGNLTPIESSVTIPFPIRRAYWVYDVPGGAERTGHAYRTVEEFIVALSGSLDVVVDDGARVRTIQLVRSYFGLYLPALLWRSLTNFSTNAVCLRLASQPYSEAEYIRDHDAFLAAKGRV